MKKDYLIIDRRTWRYGGDHITHLLDEGGKMCCLGFRCHQMGIPEKHLLQQSDPESLRLQWDIPGLIDAKGYNTTLTTEAIHINDNDSISNEEREKSLIKLFAKHKITVEFKGKYGSKHNNS